MIPGSGRSHGEANGNPLGLLAWRIPRTEKAGELSPGDRKEVDSAEHLGTRSGEAGAAMRAQGPRLPGSAFPEGSALTSGSNEEEELT